MDVITLIVGFHFQFDPIQHHLREVCEGVYQPCELMWPVIWGVKAMTLCHRPFIVFRCLLPRVSEWLAKTCKVVTSMQSAIVFLRLFILQLRDDEQDNC